MCHQSQHRSGTRSDLRLLVQRIHDTLKKPITRPVRKGSPSSIEHPASAVTEQVKKIASAEIEKLSSDALPGIDKKTAVAMVTTLALLLLPTMTGEAAGLHEWLHTDTDRLRDVSVYGVVYMAVGLVLTFLSGAMRGGPIGDFLSLLLWFGGIVSA